MTYRAEFSVVFEYQYVPKPISDEQKVIIELVARNNFIVGVGKGDRSGRFWCDIGDNIIPGRWEIQAKEQISENSRSTFRGM